MAESVASYWLVTNSKINLSFIPMYWKCWPILALSVNSEKQREYICFCFFSVNLKPIKIKENASWIHGQPLAAASPVHGISGAIGQPSDDLHFGESCRDLQLDESIPNILASSQQLYGHSSFLPQSRFVSWHIHMKIKLFSSKLICKVRWWLPSKLAPKAIW